MFHFVLTICYVSQRSQGLRPLCPHLDVAPGAHHRPLDAMPLGESFALLWNHQHLLYYQKCFAAHDHHQNLIYYRFTIHHHTREPYNALLLSRA